VEVDGHSDLVARRHSSALANRNKNVVKLTFVKGASLKDPARLFNTSLDGTATPRDRRPRGEEDLTSPPSRRSFAKRSPLKQFWQVETFEESEVLRDSSPEQSAAVKGDTRMSQLISGRRGDRRSSARNTEEVQGKGNWRLFEELFRPIDFVDHTPQPGTTPDKDGVRVLYKRLRAAFPDFHPEIHWQAAAGNLVDHLQDLSRHPPGGVPRYSSHREEGHFYTVDAMRVVTARS